MKIVSAKACWIVSGAVSTLFLARLPSADAAGSVPVVQSTATPPACVENCHMVPPDVVSLTNVHPRRGASPPPQRFVGFLPQAHLVFSRVVRFPQELDIELTASGGTHETIHLPFSVPPRSSLFRFPPDARLDSVIGSNFTARILYHQGTHGHFNTYTVSQLPFMTVP